MKAITISNAVASALICGIAFSSVLLCAEETPRHRVLVELFESQGCNSCPPAAKLISEVATPEFLEKAVVLSWHVNYWDYLGWRDVFAKEEFTNRQRKYVQTGRVARLATPQWICANAASNGKALKKTVDAEARKTPDYAIDVAPRIEGKKVTARISLKKLNARAVLDANMKIVPLLILNHAKTQPIVGENKGALLVEHFVVLQGAPFTPASTALDKPIDVSFDFPEKATAENLSVAVLLENSETLTTLECICARIDAK